jgi:outer membrane protein OmpA-like peptidoglycan-associated protein
MISRQLASAATALAVFTGIALADDISGSTDHPLIGRFAGAEINAYDYREFDEYKFAGQKVGPDGAAFQPVEGVVTRIAYTLPGNHSLAEVARNYKIALADKGFDIVIECETDACGGGDFAYGVETFPLPLMILNVFNFRYIGARLTRDNGDVYAAVILSLDNDKQVRIQVTAVETAALTVQMVDAKAMKDAFAEKGSVALYGIYFDADKADIKPESAPTLAEMARFLNDSPDLTVVIVGHTDNQGTMEYNLDLSHRRAQAVAAALVAGYGIAGDRLTAAGAGFLAPVAPNDGEAGRAKNRRVEMIPR